jgi:hypothetical protein
LEEETRVIRNYIRHVISDLKKGFLHEQGICLVYRIPKDKYTSDGEKAEKTKDWLKILLLFEFYRVNLNGEKKKLQCCLHATVLLAVKYSAELNKYILVTEGYLRKIPVSRTV